MNQLALLKLGTLGTRSQRCPPDDVWIEIAAGISRQDSDLFLEHAASCDYCGPLLRLAAESMSPNETREEEAFLNSLNSVGPEWQGKMARALSAGAARHQSGQGRTFWRSGLFSWPGLAVATTAIALVAVAVWWGVRLLRPASAEQLLAEAYTERRTLEVRIPGARYSALRVERGEAESNLEKPETLLKAEAIIGENLKRNPTDPAWLDARARADLLDGHYDSAIDTLRRALMTAPDSAPLLTDLGAAYYMEPNRPTVQRTLATRLKRWVRRLSATPTIQSPCSIARWHANSSFSIAGRQTIGITICTSTRKEIGLMRREGISMVSSKSFSAGSRETLIRC